MTLAVHPTAAINVDARIYPSKRGTRITIGAATHVDAFAVIRCVGGDGDMVVGDHCYINHFCVLYSGNGIPLGNDVLLAPGVQLVPTNHDCVEAS